MPLQRCQLNGKQGWKWGASGKCYTYEEKNETSQKTARRKAARQGVVVMASEGTIKLQERDEE